MTARMRSRPGRRCQARYSSDFIAFRLLNRVMVLSIRRNYHIHCRPHFEHPGPEIYLEISERGFCQFRTGLRGSGLSANRGKLSMQPPHSLFQLMEYLRPRQFTVRFADKQSRLEAIGGNRCRNELRVLQLLLLDLRRLFKYPE